MNRYETAIEWLYDLKHEIRYDEQSDAIDIAIDCIEKQIPKKPIEKVEVRPVYDDVGAINDADMFVNLHCPLCGNWVGMADNGCSEFCDQCGQRIDYKEVE